MKKLLLLVPVAGLLSLSTGCATPAYSPQERHQRIARNADYDGRQAVDDFDTIFLLQPASHLTRWNVR